MSEKVLAAVRTAPGVTELRDFPMPDIPEDGALMRVEVAGICGTDVKMYAKPPFDAPVIMGHENVGIVERMGTKFAQRHGLVEGDRIFVEHYVGCFRCEWCHIGQYRHCEYTDWRTNPTREGTATPPRRTRMRCGAASRSISTSLGTPSSIESLTVSLPSSQESSRHCPTESSGRSSRLVSATTPPFSSKDQDSRGLSQTVACKQAGASLIIVTGTTRDRARLELAKELGADVVIDVLTEDPTRADHGCDRGQGVDVVLDCTAGAGVKPVLLGIDALKRREGRLLIQGELASFPDFPVKLMTEKAITMHSARGHSYRACELALRQLASGRFPLEKLTTHTFGLDQVDRAIRAVGGEVEEDVIHVSLLPWKDR
jgi:threonine dehydrogenase-like Zn-dependent dehydrogenase